MKKLIYLFAPLFLFEPLSQAQTPTVPPPWTHESELGVVTVSGNTESESYSGKQTTTHHWGADSVSVTGRYLETKARSTVTAKSWDLGARYEKAINDLWSAFIGHKAESDTFAGYVQKDSTDIGAKYNIKKTEDLIWFAELGMSYLKTLKVAAQAPQYDLSSRLYTEATKKIEKNLSLKYWIEYLQSVRRSDVYFINTELSLNVMLNDRFSLKTGYLLKYHNELIPPTTKYADSTFTTSLVAHF